MTYQIYGSNARRQTCHGPEPCGPGVGQQAHCDRDEDDHQHLGAIRRGGAVVARESDGMFTFVATQSRQNSLPSMSCITRHDSL
jgi:hypothetical protein